MYQFKVIILIILYLIFCLAVAIGIFLGLIPYCFYYLPFWLGLKRKGKWLVICYFSLLICVLFATLFEDELFSKRDAKTALAGVGLFLKDDFKILSNHTSSDLQGKYYHDFELNISSQDQMNLARQIRTSQYFISDSAKLIEFIPWIGLRDSINEVTQDCERVNDHLIFREHYKSNGKHRPAIQSVQIDLVQKKLRFEETN